MTMNNEFPRDPDIESLVRLSNKKRIELLNELSNDPSFPKGLSKQIEFLVGLSDYERITVLDIIQEYI